jgi:hypothetical protein
VLPSLQAALVSYFTAHTQVKLMDLDGGMIKSRPFHLTEEDLWARAQASLKTGKVKEATQYLDYSAYLQVPLFGDLKSEWDIRVSPEMMEQLVNDKEFLQDQEHLDVFLFYLTLLARGILFLHKNLGGAT